MREITDIFTRWFIAREIYRLMRSKLIGKIVPKLFHCKITGARTQTFYALNLHWLYSFVQEKSGRLRTGIFLQMLHHKHEIHIKYKIFSV